MGKIFVLALVLIGCKATEKYPCSGDYITQIKHDTDFVMQPGYSYLKIDTAWHKMRINTHVYFVRDSSGYNAVINCTSINKTWRKKD